MAETFPSWQKMSQEAKQILKINSKKSIPRHMMVKLLKIKNKQKITETVRKQQLVYGRKTIQRREDFHDTVKARSQGHKELDMTE